MNKELEAVVKLCDVAKKYAIFMDDEVLATASEITQKEETKLRRQLHSIVDEVFSFMKKYQNTMEQDEITEQEPNPNLVIEICEVLSREELWEPLFSNKRHGKSFAAKFIPEAAKALAEHFG